MTTFPLQLGSHGQEVTDLDRAAVRRYKGYALEADGVTPLKVDGYYGLGEQKFATTWQTRMHRQVTGKITADEFNYIVHGTPFPPPPVAHIEGAWIYTCPGSGARGDVGPSFEVGDWCEKNLGLRHQWVYFQQGGYLGFMGGDPGFSYNDVIYDQYKSIEWLLDNNPDVQKAMQQLTDDVPIDQVKLALWWSAYSQSADGLEDALEILFGDGGFKIPKTGETAGPGKYRALRPFLRYALLFGNPSRGKGTDGGAPGYFPPGWGISRKIRPEWLRRVSVSITNPNDFYACVPDSDIIRPLFYGEIVEADISLPFFVHVLNIAVPVILQAMPFFGAFLTPLSPLVPMAIGTFTGLLGMMGPLTNLLSQGQTQGAYYDAEVDKKIIALLSPMGILQNIPALIGLIAALPGLQNHGSYHLPFPELGNRSGQQVGCDIVRNYYHK